MTDFAWLIEAPAQHYLAVRKAPGDYRGEFHWTRDANKALRFWSKEQADFTATAVRRLVPDLWGFAGTLGEAWPREHGFAPLSPREPSAGTVSQDEPEMFWLILHEPRCVPELKGPWPTTQTKAVLREFIAARPVAYIDVLTVMDGKPSVQHGPEALQMADGRSMSVGRRHNAQTAKAHDSSPSEAETWGWQPIESAPRDGTVVLLGHEHAVFDGWWENEAWVDGATNSYDELREYPATHWRPLPPPPTPKSGGGE